MTGNTDLAVLQVDLNSSLKRAGRWFDHNLHGWRYGWAGSKRTTTEMSGEADIKLFPIIYDIQPVHSRRESACNSLTYSVGP